MLLHPLILLFTALTCAASPLPVSRSTVNNGITRDAPFSLTRKQLDSVALQCPNGVQKAASKNILFVHGTGGTGDATWLGGFLPAFHAQGFNGCYVNLPNLTLGDAQITSEYVVSAIQRLYKLSGNEQILLVGHSQGNLNIQWALNYWPSTRKMVANFASLAGDFHGTAEGPLVEAVQNLALNGTSPSVIQQSVLLGQPSNYLKALNKRGNLALVPTTSTYGLDDEVIQPVEPDTLLGSGGAAFTHVSVQSICPLMVVDHFLIIINRVSFYLALDAFKHGSAASVSRVKATYTDICDSITAPGVTNMAIPDDLQEALEEALALGTDGLGSTGGILSQRALIEPKLMSYALE